MTVERLERAAFRNGHEQGVAEGEQQKAVEAAIIAVREFKATPEFAAQKMGAPLELVREGLKKKTVTFAFVLICILSFL